MNIRLPLSFLLSFNSLQTGNHIQRIDEARKIPLSIMFQFPSNGKPYTKKAWKSLIKGLYNCFNSLQTGKHIQSRRITAAPHSYQWVSIPFKRETISKENNYDFGLGVTLVSIPFKRETISKVKMSYNANVPKSKVSIPFKRESISKAVSTTACGTLKVNSCFNSLQTGNHIQRK